MNLDTEGWEGTKSDSKHSPHRHSQGPDLLVNLDLILEGPLRWWSISELPLLGLRSLGVGVVLVEILTRKDGITYTVKSLQCHITYVIIKAALLKLETS